MVLERKIADRPNWSRVTGRAYAQSYINTREFTGYISLLGIKKVRDPLYINVGGRRFCIADDGYFWLQQFPSCKHHSVTTMFDSEMQAIQWYIDICKNIRLDERNVPCFDDLFLDITVLPSGEVIILDINELEDALTQGVIDEPTYELSWREANRIIESVQCGEFELLKLSKVHLDMLLEQLK